MVDANETEVDAARLHDAVAHDLNNLLTAISGYASEVASTLPAAAVALSDLEQIQIAVEEAAALAALFRPATLASNERSVDLARAARTAVRLLRKLLPSSVGIRTDGPSSGPRVPGDPGPVLEILVAAGRRLGSPPGVREVLLSPLEERGRAGVRVLALGPGGARRTEGPFAGVPRRLAELARSMRGEILSDGGEWVLHLRPSSVTDGGRPQLGSVLVVEPDALLRSFLVSALGARRTESTGERESARSALRARGAGLDLLVASLDAGSADAAELYRELRAAGSRAPVLFLGNAKHNGGEIARIAEADPQVAVVVKPFGVKELSHAVHRLRGGRWAPAEAAEESQR